MTAHLTSWIADYGLVAVFVLMGVDAVLPAGGELVMLFGGALAAGAIAGHAGPSLAAVVVAGTLGYLAGSLGGWAIGRAGGREFVEHRGRWLHIGIERFERAERWFARWGSVFVFAGRLTPLVRSFVSIPAGVLEFPLGRYTALTAAASVIWCLAFWDCRPRARQQLAPRPRRVPLRRLRRRRRSPRCVGGRSVHGPP